MNNTTGFIVQCSTNVSHPDIPLVQRAIGGGSFLLLGTLSLLANGALLLLLCKYRNLRSPAGWIMFNMVVSDIIRALMAVIFVVPIVSLNCFPFPKPLLKMYTVLTLTSYVKSVISIMYVTLDRYFAVCRPLHYVNLVTKQRVMYAELMSWCLSVLYAASSLVSQAGIDSVVDDLSSKSVVFYVYIVLPWLFPLFTIVLYCLMLRHVRRRRKVSCAPGVMADLPQYRPQVMLAATMALVTAIFLLSNLPIICVGAVISSDADVKFIYVARGIAGFLFYTSCLLNPIVYVASFRPIRMAGKNLLCAAAETREDEVREIPSRGPHKRNAFYVATTSGTTSGVRAC